MTRQRDLHLASASPRRRKILQSLGVAFSYGGEDLDERREHGETAADLVLRLAAGKAAAAARHRDACTVLGADTAVVVDERIFGKPDSRQQALDMLAKLSGRIHHVVTGIAVLAGGRTRPAVSTTKVRFRPISRAEAALYWQTGEPRDKAGGYAIQGLAAIFAEELQGSYSGVVGLPVFETAALLREAGFDVLARARGG